MKVDRRIWATIVLLSAWSILRPLAQELLVAAGLQSWMVWSIYIAGLLAIGLWLVRWLYRRAAPARERLERARREHPNNEVWLVGLDSEWNPVADSMATLLLVDGEELAIEGAVTAPADTVVSVMTTYVTPRQLALSIVVGETTWTAVVLDERWGVAAGRSPTVSAAARLSVALGLGES